MKGVEKSPTSRDVAKLAGFSQSTVSRVFNENQTNSVKPLVRDSILKAAEKLGYIPNLVARGMISGKTNVIGIVIGEGIGPFYHSVIMNVIEKVQESGKQCLVFKLNKREKIEKIILKVMQFKVEAVIITSPAITKNIEKICNNQKVPFVLFNRLSENRSTNAVYTDAAIGGTMAAKHFIDNGHINIGFIHYQVDTAEEAEKKFSFFTTLRNSGIYQVLSEASDYTYSSGYNAGIQLIPKLKLPCAVFCTSDLIALGVIDAVRFSLELRVPEDVSVLGYDDIAMSEWKAYNLDTIRQPVTELAEKTVSALFESINNEIPQSNVIKVETSLIKRGSVAKLNFNDIDD